MSAIASSRRLAGDLASLWFQAPLVIALRCQSMAAAAMTGKPQDGAELTRMVTEKAAATLESAQALNMEMMRLGMATLLSPARAARGPQLSAGDSRKLASGALRPYAKRVRANSRRLT